LEYFSKFLDIPNRETAKLTSASVFLLAGSLDSAVATYQLLSKEERIVRGNS